MTNQPDPGVFGTRENPLTLTPENVARLMEEANRRFREAQQEIEKKRAQNLNDRLKQMLCLNEPSPEWMKRMVAEQDAAILRTIYAECGGTDERELEKIGVYAMLNNDLERRRG